MYNRSRSATQTSGKKKNEECLVDRKKVTKAHTFSLGIYFNIENCENQNTPLTSSPGLLSLSIERPLSADLLGQRPLFFHMYLCIFYELSGNAQKMFFEKRRRRTKCYL